MDPCGVNAYVVLLVVWALVGELLGIFVCTYFIFLHDLSRSFNVGSINCGVTCVIFVGIASQWDANGLHVYLT